MKYFLGSLLILTDLCTGTMAVGYNENCTINENCTDSNTRCLDSLCVCNNYYQYIDGNCITSPLVDITSDKYSQVIGGDITIPCTVSDDATSAYWTFTAVGGSEENISSSGRYSVFALPNPDLTITSLNTIDAGTYKCKASNGAGESSDMATLNITGGTLTVSIIKPPSTKIGENVAINCSWSGQPNATAAKWEKDDSLLDISNSIKYSGGTVSVPSLTIKSVTHSDAGSYQCLVTNAAGTAESSKITLTTIDLQYGDTCNDSLPCNDSMTLECVNTKCQCKDTHYVNNNICFEKNQLNEACSNVMLCINDPQVMCNGSYCVCNSGYYDSTGSVVGGSCQPKKQLNEACSNVMLCVNDPQVMCNGSYCVCNSGYYDSTGSAVGGSCQPKKQLNEACSNVMLCVNDPQVMCNGSYCVCNSGYYDSTGSAVGGSCQPKKQLNEACSNVMLCVNDPQVMCNGSYCICNSGYYDSTGSAVGGSCQPKKQLNEACSNVMLCVNDPQVMCNGSYCVCNSGYYDSTASVVGGSCQPKKQLNEACSNVMLCVNDPQVMCNGSYCVCNSGYYDSTGSVVGGSCQPKKQLNEACSNVMLCVNDPQVMCNGSYCVCNSGYYDSTASVVGGSCQPKKQLNEACSNVMLCVNDPQVMCNGSYCVCNSGYYDSTGSVVGGSCQPKKQPNEACSNVMLCVNDPQVMCNGSYCVCNSGYYDSTASVVGGSCQPKKQLNEACSIVMLCVNDPQVMCNGSYCVCNSGYYDSTGSAVGGSCQPKKQLNEACSNVMLCVNDPQVMCNGSYCVCNSGYYDSTGSAVGGSCQPKKQLNEACNNVMLCVNDPQVMCNGSNCACNSGYYDSTGSAIGGSCQPKKKLNEACSNVMLCVNNPQVMCNGSNCVCNSGYYDSTGSVVGGSCQPRKSPGYSCNETVLCLENIRCATDNTCRCPDNFYDDNKATLNGTCKNISELKVMTFSLTATTDAITVTWTPPSTQSYISRYDVRWRVSTTGKSAFNTELAGTENTFTINQNLVAGQAYDVYIESVDGYTQVVEQKVASERKIIRLKPNAPGNITNPDALDAPNINLMWTASPGIVARYTVTVVEKNSTESTTDNTPRMIIQTVLVPGVYYTIRITAVSGGPMAPGGETVSEVHEERIRTIVESGETVSEVHEERIRTMVEKPSPPQNVACPMNPKDRSLAITWSSPTHPNGIIQYYKVRVYYANGSLKEENQTKGANLTFNVQNLTPESTFRFAVSAVNNGTEDSDWSSQIYCTTKAALSEKPLSLDVINIGSRNFTVTFNKPATTNGRLTGYVVFVYQEEKTPQKCVQQILLRCSDCGNNYTLIKPNSICLGKEVYHNISNLPDAISISYIVIDLLPYMDYKVEAAGISASGVGYLAKIQNFIQTEEEVPNKPSSITVSEIMETSVKLEWTIEGPRPGPTNITVTVYEIIGAALSMNRTHIIESAFSTTEYTVQNLEEYWNYQFTVAAATVIGSVTSDMSTVIRTLPTAPGKVLDLDVSKGSQDNYTAVLVTWKIPPLHQRNSYLEKYVIENNFTSGGNVVEINVDYNRESNTEVFGVTPETCYIVEVYTKNNESSNSNGEISQMDYCAPAGPPQPGKIQNILTTNAGSEQPQTSTFVVELNVDLFNDNTNGRVEFYGIAVCKINKCMVQIIQGASTSEWINLQNYQTARSKDFPLYRATDERFIQNMSLIMSQVRRRKRATSMPFTIGSETCANNSANYYCNGPLPPGTSFRVFVFMCTAGGCSHVSFGPFKTLEISVAESLASWVVIIIVLCTIAVVAAITVFVIFRIRKMRKTNRQKKKEDTYTDLTIRNTYVTQSQEEAYASLQPRSIRQNRPVPVNKFLSLKMELEADSGRLMAIEFNDLMSLSGSVLSAKASHTLNRHKNRTQSVIPSDKQRLRLGEKGDEADDYINASLIQIPLMSDHFECIATQQPLPETTADFWQMVWERNVSFIIMLNSISECQNIQYWPIEEGCSKSYGAFSVKVVASFSSGNRSVLRMFEVSKGKKVKNTKQLHFESWRTFSKHDVCPILDFLEIMESNIEKSKTRKSTVIHCSDGSGRTGVYLCVYFVLSLIKRGASKIDIFDAVHRLLQSRTNIIQNEEEYRFIYECISVYISKKSKDNRPGTRQSGHLSNLQRYPNTSDKSVYEHLP